MEKIPHTRRANRFLSPSTKKVWDIVSVTQPIRTQQKRSYLSKWTFSSRNPILPPLTLQGAARSFQLAIRNGSSMGAVPWLSAPFQVGGPPGALVQNVPHQML